MTKLDAGLITSLPASDSGSAAVWGSKRINPRPQSCLCQTCSGCPSNDDDDDYSVIHACSFTNRNNLRITDYSIAASLSLFKRTRKLCNSLSISGL